MHHLTKLGSYRIAAGAGWIALAAGLWWLVSANVWSAHKKQDGGAQAAPAEKQKRKDDDELKSRLGRTLSQALDDEEEGDDDQRDLIRKILKETDDRLVDILDKDAREAIRAINCPLQLPECVTEPCGPRRIGPPAAPVTTDANPRTESEVSAATETAPAGDEADAPSL